MVEKYPTDSSVVCQKNRTEEKTNELEVQISTINKEIRNFSVEIITKDQILLRGILNT